MNAFRLRARFAVLSGLLLASPLRADVPAPPLAEQLRRAQAANDSASVVELCRRRLSVPGVDSASVLQTLFRAQLAAGEYPGTKATLDRLEKTAPTAAAAVAEGRGDLALADGNHLDEALAAWRAAVAADSDNLVGVLGKIADALDGTERWEEAAGAFRAVLRLSPGHPARQARLAVCLLNAGHPADADREIQAATRADAADETVKAAAPTFDRLRPQLPVLKKLEERLATGNLPGEPGVQATKAGANTLQAVCLDRAVIFYRAGAFAAALPDAKRAYKSSGKAMSSRLLLGQCLWQLDRGKEAAALGVAKMNDRKWFDDPARFNRLRDADDARWTSFLPGVVKLHTVGATTLLEADQPALALELARRASESNLLGKLHLDDPEVVLAVAELRNGHAAEALLAARRATEYAPGNPDGWAVLGRVEQETRADYDTAAEHLSRALALREEPCWLRRRETCLRTLGRNAEADRDAKRLAQLPPVS